MWLEIDRWLDKWSYKKMFCKYLANLQENTPMPKRDFNKVAKKLYWNHTLLRSHFNHTFIEIKLYWNHTSSCPPVTLLRIFTTPFPKNTSGGFLLTIGLKWIIKETQLIFDRKYIDVFETQVLRKPLNRNKTQTISELRHCSKNLLWNWF